MRNLRPGELKPRTIIITTLAFVLVAGWIVRNMSPSRSGFQPAQSAPSSQTTTAESLSVRLAHLISRLDSIQTRVRCLEVMAHCHRNARSAHPMSPRCATPDSSMP